VCKEKDTTILRKSPESLSGWDRAIYDTEQKISLTKHRLTELKAALGLFRERRNSGEPWPGEEPKRRSRKAKKGEAKKA
jgi:hypothetical protein